MPEDAERLGLTPLTAPGLQVASALHDPSPQAKKYFWALAGLVALILIVVLVAAFS